MGSVTMYWCSTETSGTFTPTVAASARVHCPAQQTTTSQSMRPLSVTTAVTLPSSVSIERSEEHTSELQSLMRISYAVFCLKKKNTNHKQHSYTQQPTNHHP